MKWTCIMIAAVMTFSSVGSALADCQGITLADRQDNRALLWRDNGRWKPIKELNDDLPNGASKTITFAYIAKNDVTKEAPQRSVVVIKSGFTNPNSTPQRTLNTVSLYRPEIHDPCRKKPYREYRDRVTSKSYEDYHARYLRTSDDERYSKFHILYDAGNSCRDSDDTSADAFFDLKNRSNRTQFSFDPERVRRGPVSHLVTWLRITPAYADEPVAGRTVQIRKYVADDKGLACVKFRVDVGPGAFLRVNDLERRTLFGNDAAEWSRDE